MITAFSCSSDDSQLIEEEQTIEEEGTNEEEQTNTDLKLYKKTESFNDGILTSTQEVYYDDNNRIELVTLNVIDYSSRTFAVSYSNGNTSGIIRTTYSVNSSGTDETINYNSITRTDDSIILVSDESDKTLEIAFSNDYVDSTKFYSTSTQNTIFDQSFIRNTNNQLVSNSTGIDSFEYSDFDINKKLDPFGSVMEYEHSTFFMIFGLKVSRDNPLTATYNFNGGGTYTNFLEYDEQGYVTKVSYGASNSTSNYSSHEYISE